MKLIIFVQYSAVVVELRAVVEQPVDKPVDQLEDKIIETFSTLWSRAAGNRERQNHLLSQLKNKLSELGISCSQMTIQRGTSLRIFIVCTSIEELEKVYKEYTSGVLKDILEAMFTLLCDVDLQVRISILEWKYEQHNKCRGGVTSKHQIMGKFELECIKFLSGNIS